ncbi:MAG: hypothetical protein J7L51_04305 [Desulfurococcales archaeon]|nr:hypothetical protein [Desulfurococcales archaeon]
MTYRSSLCNLIMPKYHAKDLKQTKAFLEKVLNTDVFGKPLYALTTDLAIVAKDLGFKDVRVPMKLLPLVQRVILEILSQESSENIIKEFEKTFRNAVNKVISSKELYNVRKLLGIKVIEDFHFLASVLIKCPHCEGLFVPSTGYIYRIGISSRRYLRIHATVNDGILEVSTEILEERPIERSAGIKVSCPICNREIVDLKEHVYLDFVPLLRVPPSWTRIDAVEGVSWKWDISSIREIVSLSRSISSKFLDEESMEILSEILDPVGLLVWSLIVRELKKMSTYENELYRKMLSLVFAEYADKFSKRSIISPIGHARGFIYNLMRASPIRRPWLSVIPGENPDKNVIMESLEAAMGCLEDVRGSVALQDIKLENGRDVRGVAFIRVFGLGVSAAHRNANTLLSAFLGNVHGDTLDPINILETLKDKDIEGMITLFRDFPNEEFFSELERIIAEKGLRKKFVSIVENAIPAPILVLIRGDNTLKVHKKVIKTRISPKTMELYDRIAGFAYRVTYPEKFEKADPEEEILFGKALRKSYEYLIILVENPTPNNILKASKIIEERPEKGFMIYPYAIETLGIYLAVLMWPKEEGGVEYTVISMKDPKELEHIVNMIKNGGETRENLYVLGGYEAARIILDLTLKLKTSFYKLNRFLEWIL